MTEHIILKSIKPNTHTNYYYMDKKCEKIADLTVQYYDLQIFCWLIRGMSNKNEYYHFICMPANYFKRKNKNLKFNLNNFCSKMSSDDFQQIVMSQLVDQYPQFFEDSLKQPVLSNS